MTRAKTRRQYGTGSVYRRGDGRFVGVVEAGYTERGTRRRITVTGKSEADVKTRLKERARQVKAEGVPAEVSNRTTVKGWSDTWLAMTQRTLRPKPWATDKSAIGKWVVPTIGHRRLDQLTPADIRAVSEAQRAKGRSTSTAHRTHVTLLSMLRAAQQEGHEVPERVLGVKAPALAVHDRTAMTIPESLAMLHVASFLPHGSVWAFAFLHGLRQGELLGLTWPAVNLETGLVTIEWQLQPLPYVDVKDKALGFRIPDGYEVRHLTGCYHLVRPKTKKGFRVFPLLPAMAEALQDWREVAPENEWGLVWPAADGRPADDKDHRTEWYAMQGTANIGHPAGRYYYPHEARHTTATGLLEDGADPHQITALMGHSSILTTRGYQHPSQRAALEMLEAAAKRFELG